MSTSERPTDTSATPAPEGAQEAATGDGRTVALGIVGFGNQGSAYARIIAGGKAPHLRIGAICDTDPAALDRARETYPGIPLHADLDALLDSGDADAVVTCVPHYDHPAVAIAAIERGVPTLVEKPAAVHTAQVEHLNAVALAHPEVPFAIMFNQRNNPLFRRIHELVTGGEIGEVLRSTWIITTWWRPQGYYDQSAWRATWGGEGGGVLVNQAPHQLDLWQWICGVPRSVFAKAGFGSRRDIAVEDDVTALADYGDGRTGVLVTATHDLVGTDRLEIQGTRGKIVVEKSAAATLHRYDDDEKAISDSYDVEGARRLMQGEAGSLQDHVTTEQVEVGPAPAWGGQHAGVLENFALNILDGTPLLAPGTDGIQGVRLANAIHLSAWTGREVPLDFDQDEYLRELNARIEAEGDYPLQVDPRER